MASESRSGRRSIARGLRWFVQSIFLALFVLLAFMAAFPPMSLPSSNVFLRFDPLGGLFAVTASRSLGLALSFWPAWIILLVTMVSSRFFCGWICPLGTCFDLVGLVKPRSLERLPSSRKARALLRERRRGQRPRRVRVKYVLLALVVTLSMLGINLLYFASPLSIMNRTVYYVLALQIPFAFIALILLSLFYRSRFWCEEICPLGAFLSLASLAGKKLKARFSPLSVVKEPAACIECGACYRACRFGVEEPFTSRSDGRLSSADCTACGDCVDACPAPAALSMNCFGLGFYGSGGTDREEGETVCTGYETSRRDSRRDSTEGAFTLPPSQEDRLLQAGGSVDGSRRNLTLSRREFVASLGIGAVLVAGYGIGLRGIDDPVLRMPGAQDESVFLAACARCGECTRACPSGCISPMGIEGGLQKLWTPRFYPRTACCIFDQCDQACARVCPHGAIDVLEASRVRIGTAHVDRDRCLAYGGGICLACKERCRFDAIEVDGRRRPHIDAQKCTGCGACQQTCPTQPASIQVFTAGEPPQWSASGGGKKNRRGR